MTHVSMRSMKFIVYLSVVLSNVVLLSVKAPNDYLLYLSNFLFAKADNKGNVDLF
jgi:hypothetical protein